MRLSSSLRDLLVLVLALVIIGWLWRFPAVYYLAAFAGLIGLLHVPSRLRMVQGWAWITKWFGKVLQTVLLSLVFYLLLTPMGFWRRTMDRYKGAQNQTLPNSNWHKPEPKGKNHFRSPG